MLWFSRRYIWVAAMLFASACSPYVYKGEVASFANSVKGATSAYSEEIDAIVADARAGEVRRGRGEILRSKKILSMTDDCDQLAVGNADAGLKCNVSNGLVVLGAASAIDELEVRKARAALKALESYAAGLTAISNAEDAAALDAATAKLAASLSGVVKLAEQNGAQLGGTEKAIGPVLALATSVGQIILDQRRLQTLRAVANGPAGPAIEKIAALLDESLIYARRIKAITAYGDLDNAVTDWNVFLPLATRTERAELLDGVVTALSSSRNAAYRLKAKGPFAKISDAHTALLEAVSAGPTPEQLAALAANLAELNDQVDAVREALSN